jgi:protein O-GlcNAc transferase
MTASPIAIAQLLQRALQSQIANNLPMAEALYRQVLERQPRNALALHNLGLILHGKAEQSNKTEGLKLVERSLKLLPNNIDFNINLSTLYISMGAWDNASRLCKTVLSARPNFAGGHQNMGCVYSNLGQLQAAEACFVRAVQLDPKSANALGGLGTVLLQQHRLEAAKQLFNSAISIDENCYDALVGMARISQTCSHFEAACQHLMRAVRLRPAVCDNYANLGGALAMLGKYSEALQAFQYGLSIDNNHYGCKSNLVLIYGALSRHEDAALAFSAMKEKGAPPATLWSNYLFTKLYDPATSAETLFALHVEFGRSVEAPYKASWPMFVRNRTPNRRLRLGYVSGDFRGHSVANFILPILRNHDRSQFEIHCYSSHALIDDTTNAIIGAIDHWRPLAGLREIEMRDKIRTDELDILIDLSGHTAHNILGVLAQKLAPIQITWLGYPGTTGLTAMDYRITDANLDPVSVTDQYHTEKLLRLPVTNAAFQPEASSPDVNALPALKNGYFTFACLNLSAKINAAVVACWAPILLALPTAKLILCDVGDAGTAERLIALFAQHGVSTVQIQTKPRMSFGSFLALHHEIDLAFDPFPYNGGTTNLHALWMGVPMITLPGATTVSNVGAAVLRPLQLDTFIATSAENYAQIAIAMAHNPMHLANIRATLRERIAHNTPTSHVRITQELEQLLREAWTNWCADTAPSSKD